MISYTIVPGENTPSTSGILSLLGCALRSEITIRTFYPCLLFTWMLGWRGGRWLEETHSGKNMIMKGKKGYSIYNQKNQFMSKYLVHSSKDLLVEQATHSRKTWNKRLVALVKASFPPMRMLGLAILIVSRRLIPSNDVSSTAKLKNDQNFIS